MKQVFEHEKSQSELETRQSLKLRETPKTLLFALFNSILEFNGRPLLSEGEQAMRSEDGRECMRRSSSLEKKRLRQIPRGAG
jgi:hypothetical protein